MYVLDTNVVSELRKVKDGKADRNVAAWTVRVPAATLFLSSITILELEYGVLRLERRDAIQGSILREWLERYVLPTFQSHTLAVDTTVARRCAALHVPDRRPERDAFIGATALVHGMTVVTRNVADFGSMGVPVFNPWEP
jgi:predicted nucleic acid-binding protein